MPDVHIYHVAEDNDSMATPVFDGLSRAGLDVERHIHQLGKPLSQIFDNNLVNFRCGVLILGPNFIRIIEPPLADWKGLFDRAILQKAPILPVWLEQEAEVIGRKWPYLTAHNAFGLCLNTDSMIEKVLNEIEPESTHFTRS